MFLEKVNSLDSTKDKTRTFIALDLPGKMRHDLAKVQNDIKEKDLFVANFTSIQNLHLTLKFLNELDEETIVKVKEKLKQIRAPKFTAKVSKYGVFTPSFIKIVWAKLDGADELQKDIDEQLKDLFEPEHRFMSHITLFRVKSVPDQKKAANKIKNYKTDISGEIKSFSLIKSTLTKTGPIHEVLETFKLN